jgi:hypothetical protein
MFSTWVFIFHEEEWRDTTFAVWEGHFPSVVSGYISIATMLVDMMVFG